MKGAKSGCSPLHVQCPLTSCTDLPAASSLKESGWEGEDHESDRRHEEGLHDDVAHQPHRLVQLAPPPAGDVDDQQVVQQQQHAHGQYQQRQPADDEGRAISLKQVDEHHDAEDLHREHEPAADGKPQPLTGRVVQDSPP
jgi:hypothetical protein